MRNDGKSRSCTPKGSIRRKVEEPPLVWCFCETVFFHIVYYTIFFVHFHTHLNLSPAPLLSTNTNDLHKPKRADRTRQTATGTGVMRSVRPPLTRGALG